jgi:hypothetical protein
MNLKTQFWLFLFVNCTEMRLYHVKKNYEIIGENPFISLEPRYHYNI